MPLIKEWRRDEGIGTLTQTVLVERRGLFSADLRSHELCQRGHLAACLHVAPAPVLCHLAPTQHCLPRNLQKRRKKWLCHYFESSQADLLVLKKKKKRSGKGQNLIMFFPYQFNTDLVVVKHLCVKNHWVPLGKSAISIRTFFFPPFPHKTSQLPVIFLI